MSVIRDVIQFTEEQKKGILKEYNRDPESIKADLENLKKWFLEQPHLPKIELSEHRLQNMLLFNKMSIEKTKRKLDMYFTVRRLIPEFYENNHPTNTELQEQAKAVYYLPLRKLTKDLHRPILMRFNEGSSDIYDPFKHFAHALNIIEIRLDYDCVAKPVFIFDIKPVTASLMVKMTPTFLKKMMYVIEKAFSDRTTGLHFVNCPSIIDKFITVLKSVLTPKMAARVVVHKDLETLYQYVPKEILPKEYGGDDISVHELHDLWQKALEEHTPWLEKLSKMEINEELRPGELINDDILGFYGNFRQLQLD